MSAAKWIKIKTTIWDDDSRIKRIEKMPDRDSIMIIWLKINTEAGKCNAGGTLSFTDVIPMDVEMMAEIFNRDQDQIQRAIDLFLDWGMLEQDDDGFYSITDWEDNQNEEALSKMRQQNADRVKRFRERKKAEQQERQRERAAKDSPPAEPPEQKVLPPYYEIIDYLNEVAGKKFTVTDAVKKWINARFKNGFTLEDFKTVIDKKFAEWNNTPNAKYIRPQTLFTPDNFQAYLNQPWPKGRKGARDNEAGQSSGSSSRNSQFVE